MKRPDHSIGDLWELAKSGHHVDIRRASKANQRDGYDIVVAWAKGQDRSFAGSPQTRTIKPHGGTGWITITIRPLPRECDMPYTLVFWEQIEAVA